MNPWFRMYHEVLDDSKVQRLPAATFKAWVNLLCLAARNDGRLPGLDGIAFALRFTPPKAQALLSELKTAGLIDQDVAGYLPHNWKGRQFKSDGSTERVKRFRNVTSAVTETPPATGPDTDTETDSDSEPQKPPAFVTTELDFQDLWKAYPNRKERKEALRHFKADVKTPEDLGDIRRALEAYVSQRSSENARRRAAGQSVIDWQNGSTWFNNWRDWIPEDFEKPDDAHGPHTCKSCESEHSWMCEDPEACLLSVAVSCPEFRAQHHDRMAVKA